MHALQTFSLKSVDFTHESLSLYRLRLRYISETNITFISHLISHLMSHRPLETDLTESFSLFQQEGLEWNQLEHRISPPQRIPNATS